MGITIEDISTLHRALIAVANGAAAGHVNSIPPVSLSRALNNAVAVRDETAEGATQEAALKRLNDYVDIVNRSAGTCSTAAINASWEACRITGDFVPLRNLLDAHVANEIDAAEAHIIAAVALPTEILLPEGVAARWERLTRALRLCPTRSQAWYAAATLDDMVLPVEFDGVSYPTRHDLLRKAVSCPDALALHWYDMAMSVPDAEGHVVVVDGRGPMSRRDCLVQVVRLDPSWANAFFELARSMGPKEVVRLTKPNGVRDDVGVAWCLARALNCGCDARFVPAAWHGLMCTLGTISDIVVDGQPVTLALCCAKVIETGPASVVDEAWTCLLECLEHQAKVGAAMDASLPAKMSRANCAAQVVRRFPKDPSVWVILARALEEEGPSARAYIGDVAVGAVDAFAKALECDPQAVTAWIGLAKTMRPNQFVTLKGKRVGLIDAAHYVSSRYPKRVDSWELFAPLFDRDKFVDLPDGKLWSCKDWCATILGLDARHPEALYRMAKTLGSGGDAALMPDGRTLTVRNCLTDCLAADESFTAAWQLLHTTMGPSEKVNMSGVTMTRDDVGTKVQAAGEYSTAANWIALGKLLHQRNGVQKVGQRSVTAADCFAKALDLDPGNTEAALSFDQCFSAPAAAPPAVTPKVVVKQRS